MNIEPRTLARRDDPGTSKAAAAADRITHRARLLAAFYAYGDMTYTEAAHAADLEPHEAMRRMSDLKRLGLLEVATFAGHSIRRRTPSGREADVHRVTDAGKRAVRADTQGLFAAWT